MKIAPRIKRALRRAGIIALIAVTGILFRQERRQTGFFSGHSDSPEIAALKSGFEKSKMGGEMLSYALNHGIQMQFDSSMMKGANLNYGTYNNKRVLLQPGRTEEEILSTLAHEIRHAWQDREVDYPGLENKTLTPTQQWTLRRYIEADAFVYSAYYYAQRMQELGLSAKETRKHRNLTLNMAADMKKDIDKNALTPERFRTNYFAVRFALLQGHNKTHEPMMEKKAVLLEQSFATAAKKLKKGDRHGALLGLDSLTRAFSKTVSDGEFESRLRRFGAMGLDGRAPNPLQSEKVTRHTLLNVYPLKLTGIEAEDTEFRKKLADFDKRFYTVKKKTAALLKKMQNRK